ncbi:MAG: prephenate dehydrogenase/arogenate dehydrogenase family protein [Dehalococcoidia bacterium]
MNQVTIIGLGMIGSSMGMATRASRSGVKVVGYDSNSQVHNRAKRIGAVDDTEWRLDRAVQDADLVVLAVPVLEVRDLFDQMSRSLKPGAAVTDTATTKVSVMGWARDMLPREVGFIGGNPLAGAGLSGQDEARADLFTGVTYPLTPAPRAPAATVDTVVTFVQKLGARPLFVGPEEHDSYVAAVSNLPALLSSALVLAVSSGQGWGEIGRFAADEFRDLSRLAGADPRITQGICSTNPDMVVYWMGELIEQLTALREAVQDPARDEADSALRKRLEDAYEARLRWDIGVSPDTEVPSELMPTTADGMGQMFMGGALWNRIRRTSNPDKDRSRAR